MLGVRIPLRVPSFYKPQNLPRMIDIERECTHDEKIEFLKKEGLVIKEVIVKDQFEVLTQAFEGVYYANGTEAYRPYFHSEYFFNGQSPWVDLAFQKVFRNKIKKYLLNL